MRPYVVAWLERFLPASLAQVLAPTWFTMVGVAGLLTLLVLLRRARQDGLDRGAVATVVLTAYLTAVLGGVTIPSVIALVERSINGQPAQLRMVGMTSFWGYLAGTVGAVEACRRTRVPLGWLADRMTPMLGVSLALIRTGCFLAGCDHGKITGVAWAVRFPAGSPAWRDHVERGLVPVTRDVSLPVHPTQLYEALLGVAIAIVAAVITRRRAAVGRGWVFLGAAVAYCATRLAIENLRGDRVRGFMLGLSSGQVFALAVLVAVPLWWLARSSS